MSSSRIFNRDGLPPRVSVNRAELATDPRTLERADTERAPSLRDIRVVKWNKLREEQAKDEKVTTAATLPLARPLVEPESKQSNHGRVVLEENHEENLEIFVSRNAHPNKSPTRYHPAQHHSVDVAEAKADAPQQPLSPDSGVNPGPTFSHQSRDTNISNCEQKRSPKINFPGSNDPVWKDINEELATALPVEFSNARIKSTPVSELSGKLNSWLHTFFTDKFGEAPEPKINKRGRLPRMHKGLARLRAEKKVCKAARKALHNAGLAGTPEDAAITRRWRLLLKQHNRLRLAVAAVKQRKQAVAAEKRFKKNPHEFASKLFNPVEKKGAPTFSKDAAQEYFSSTYRDEGRSATFEPPPGLERPSLPDAIFSTRSPTRKELKRSARRKRNRAAPGLNSITYVPYKKCPAIIDVLFRFSIKIWTVREPPDQWALGYTALIAKSALLNLPEEFRPITVTPGDGKIFMSVVSDRLQGFMVKNNYIRREVQKGFLSGMPGCVEHSFTLFESLRDAKLAKKQIVQAWIDLANAYGSVRHNLIQFALDWYHVPKMIQQLIWSYYERLMTMVVTKEWSTGFFLFDIGLFQGCVLSTILFDCVFQLLLDFLRPLEETGYTFKLVDVTALSKAYADDLSFSATSVDRCQNALTVTDQWLDWTGTMKAKPKKCISFAMKLFDKRIKHERFEPFSSEREYGYLPFDPKLTICW